MEIQKLNNWYYKNKNFLQEDYDKIKDVYIGFVYRIVLPDNSFYVGKKAFTHKKKSKLSKKAKLLPENKGKRVSITQKDSGWLNYYGSCVPLKQHISSLTLKEKKKIKREIICFCRTRQDLTYRELEVLVKENVLFRDDCWNGNIMSRFFKGKINE